MTQTPHSNLARLERFADPLTNQDYIGGLHKPTSEYAGALHNHNHTVVSQIKICSHCSCLFEKERVNQVLKYSNSISAQSYIFRDTILDLSQSVRNQRLGPNSWIAGTCDIDLYLVVNFITDVAAKSRFVVSCVSPVSLFPSHCLPCDTALSLFQLIDYFAPILSPHLVPV